MNLLHTETLLLSRNNLTTPFPPYAILSHRWGSDEILYSDICNGITPLAREKAGFSKLIQSCRVAASLGFTYIWIDTCCIDKSSSAELSDAINSMFTWYGRSAVCIAHLSDANRNDMRTFATSEWFSRGWTLQELIAPSNLIFYDAQWKVIGTRADLLGLVCQRTGIDHGVFMSQDFDSKKINLANRSVSTRMSWAAERRTTRVEDVAYSLLGIFDVHIPLLYGEGRLAFMRLQEAIVRKTSDQSVLAWESNPKDFECAGPNGQGYALSPSAFSWFTSMVPRPRSSPAVVVTDKGIEVTVSLCPLRPVSDQDVDKLRIAEDYFGCGLYLGVLECSFTYADHLRRPAILVSSLDDKKTIFSRANHKLYCITPETTTIQLTIPEVKRPPINPINTHVALSISETRTILLRPNSTVALMTKGSSHLPVGLSQNTPGYNLLLEMETMDYFTGAYPSGWNFPTGPRFPESPRGMTLSPNLQKHHGGFAGLRLFGHVPSVQPTVSVQSATTTAGQSANTAAGQSPTATSTSASASAPGAPVTVPGGGSAFFLLWGFLPLTPIPLMQTIHFQNSSPVAWWEQKRPFVVLATWEEVMSRPFSLAAADDLLRRWTRADPSDPFPGLLLGFFKRHVGVKKFQHRDEMVLEGQGGKGGRRKAVAVEIGHVGFLGIAGLQIRVEVKEVKEVKEEKEKEKETQGKKEKEGEGAREIPYR